MQTIPFDDVVLGGKVRFTVINDKQYLSVRDVIMCLCGKDNKKASGTWKNLPTEYKGELEAFVCQYQFPGRGNSKQPVISYEGAIKLLMWLPGSKAKTMRGTAANILARYCEGDSSLHKEISHNKKNGPANACISLLHSSIKNYKHMKRKSMPMSGWVYGTQSKAFQAVLKLGRAKDLKQRVSSGNTFCAPAKHSVVAAVPSFNPTRDEKAAHKYFAKRRCVGEFFYVTKEEVQCFFDLHLMPLYQLELSEMIKKLQE
jgi:hypothetical protein